ncbi:MAG: sigma-70 family RNA polymerase sigma factor [Thermoanaerobaculia bacterium]|nr:sigma-70 family RNA polymerase sigma factor [Thermoanaerobaculia bacterium]
MQPTHKSSGDDERIVDRVLEGDVDAFEDIVLRWQGPLLNLAYRFSRDRSLAEEMAQEAFLKVFRSLGRWRRDASFSTWMYAVALNHYRTIMRRHVPDTVELHELDAATGAGDLAGEMDQAAEDSVVRRAVALLPPKYRDAVVVYYFMQQDVAETAATLGLRPGTVKARLHRARKLLKTKLNALGHSLAAATQESAR